MNISQALWLALFLLIIHLLWNYKFKRKRTIAQVKYTNNENDLSDSVKSRDRQALIGARFLLTPVVIFCLTIGYMLMNDWFTTYNLATESVHWEVVKGRIISKEVISQADSMYTGTHQATGFTYIPEVTYEFTYKGKTHQRDTLDFNNSPAYGDDTVAKETLNALPDVGESINVYLSRKRNMTVLIPGAKNSNYFGIIAGVLIFVVGFIILKLLYKF